MFHALLIEKNDDNYQTRLTELDDSQLPEGDVTVRVEYSTLNYKDGCGFHDTWTLSPRSFGHSFHAHLDT